MAHFRTEEIAKLAELHPKPAGITFQYGTAGFRMKANLLDSVLFRVGILATLRSQRLDGQTIGVMITASHNPEEDNGVKLVDPRGEMLENSWEVHATRLANASSTSQLLEVIGDICQRHNINVQKPGRIVYARDTRPSGPALAAALEDGLKAMSAESRNEGVKTTPILHYLVRCVNTKGTVEEYGQDTENGYYQKLSTAFMQLVSNKRPAPPLLVDCANGVGTFAGQKFCELVKERLPLKLVNTDTEQKGMLNFSCGADYVKTTQKLPPSLSALLTAGQRGCSLDGDADRLIYYYIDERQQFRMLDGDKIAALVADFIVELVENSGLKGGLKVGIVQTAYANGNSTKYLSQRLPVRCVSTGVKHLHHAAERYQIGVYFEANGHGTVLFSPEALEILEKHEPRTPAQATSLNHLVNLSKLINQTVGDALSDMMLVEVVLAHKAYTGFEWDSIYTDLPNKLVKVVVPNRNIFHTEDAERRLKSPPGLQNKIDDLVRKYEGGRGFVRPSGTEDVVRVYAEASVKHQADELAQKIAGLVADEAKFISQK